MDGAGGWESGCMGLLPAPGVGCSGLEAWALLLALDGRVIEILGQRSMSYGAFLGSAEFKPEQNCRGCDPSRSQACGFLGPRAAKEAAP